MNVCLIAARSFIDSLPDRTRERVEYMTVEDLADDGWSEVVRALEDGQALITVGTAVLPRLRSLWIDSYACEAASIRVTATAVPGPLPQVTWQATPCRGLFVRPDDMYTYFGHDEMPRMELLPLAEALDGDGQARAYPAVWLKHVAPSLVGGRFAGCDWYVFAVEQPLEALALPDWAALIEMLCDHADSCITITGMRSHYACYRAGETVLTSVRLANRSAAIAAARLELTVASPDGQQWTSRWIRRCLNGHEETTVPWEFPIGKQPGLWCIRVGLYQEDRTVYGAGRVETSRLTEQAECGVVVAPEDPAGLARPEISARSLRIGDQDGFVTGVHYYPSSSWWDWAWRDFRPEQAARDIAQMERLGFRIARVWVDPELDEQALRGLEAWLVLSGMRGIVSIVCIFTQWTRHLSYPDERGVTTFEFMGPADYNVYSVRLVQIEHQRRYVATLARRWRDLPNIIWNLANEVQIVDPDPAQVDPRYFGDVAPKTGPLAGIGYFNRWADLMTQALHEAGAEQPILRGYGFPMAGDCYLQNRDGDLLVWHHYGPPEIAGPSLPFADPGVVATPLLLEEFGIPTFDERERLEHYEGVACWAAVMGATGACAYEWGVSWLARELPYVATPLKDLALFGRPDPRWGAAGQIPYTASWPIGSMGICPWAASFCYGSNYGCTPFPTPAAEALGDVARFCAEVGPPRGMEPVLLVVPQEWDPFVPQAGYARRMDKTVKAVRVLAAAHVPFSVIQEDQLGQPAERPAAVIFPVSQEVRPNTKAHLEAWCARGVTIHTGSLQTCGIGLSRYAIPLESSQPVWCLRRGTRNGHLYFLFAPEGPSEVRLKAGTTEATLPVQRYALAEMGEAGLVRTFIGRAQARTPER